MTAESMAEKPPMPAANPAARLALVTIVVALLIAVLLIVLPETTPHPVRWLLVALIPVGGATGVVAALVGLRRLAHAEAFDGKRGLEVVLVANLIVMALLLPTVLVVTVLVSGP